MRIAVLIVLLLLGVANAYARPEPRPANRPAWDWIPQEAPRHFHRHCR